MTRRTRLIGGASMITRLLDYLTALTLQVYHGLGLDTYGDEDE